jgi:hypothetical protein
MQYAQGLLSRLVQLAALFVSAALVYFWVTSVLLAFPVTRALGERLGGLFLDTVSTLGEGMLRAIPGLVVVAVIILLAQAVVEASNALFRAVARQARGRQLPAPRDRRRHPPPGGPGDLGARAGGGLPLPARLQQRGLQGRVRAGRRHGHAGLVRRGHPAHERAGAGVLARPAGRRPCGHRQGRRRCTEGVVQEVGTLATKLKTMRNEEITIPNAVLVGNPIRNYSRLADTQGTMMSTKVTIGYDAPWRQVHMPC